MFTTQNNQLTEHFDQQILLHVIFGTVFYKIKLILTKLTCTQTRLRGD